MSLLSDTVWKTKYDSDEPSLLREFYEPAIACAVRYDRTTGFFSSRVLTLASRGVEGLIRNGGRMRLIVGCTLEPADVEAITHGETLKEKVAAQVLKMPLQPASDGEEAALELVSWMIARGILDVRVAIPCDAHRRPQPSTGIFHEKAGIVEDKTGDRLAFNGSVNETPQGWGGNWESFHVFTSWTGEEGLKRVEDEESGFSRLWADKARHCLVIDVPAAVRQDLLRFLPPEDRRPRRLEGTARDLDIWEAKQEPGPAIPPPEPDARRLAWGVIRFAPALSGGGERVGEATSIVTPWPHQVRTFDRLYGQWPPRMLIADEVGLGKTIEAGLLLRQAWLAGRLPRALILAPKAVLTQWQVELREKFNLNWPIYDGQRLTWASSPGRVDDVERKVSRSEWHLEPFVITSSQLMRRADRRKELVQDAEPWALVILDEAHHARRKGAGLTKDRKPNQLLGLLQELRRRTRGLLLLTATPMQVHPVEVWDLLSLLGLPASWNEGNFTTFFERVSLPNPSAEDFEFMAQLFQAAEAHFGETEPEEALRLMKGTTRLAAKKVLAALRDAAQTERKRLETERRKAAIRLMRSCSPVARLVSRHTRDLLRRYFKAGKISTPVADRDVADVFVELSRDERRVYERVEDYISTIYNKALPDERNAVGFVMTIYRRRLASSFAALSHTLEAHLSAVKRASIVRELSEEDLPDDEAADEILDTDEATTLEQEALRLEEEEELRAILAEVKSLAVDTKTRILLEELAKLQAAGYRQVMVFSQYTDTMDFLREQLAARDIRLLCFSGRGGEVRSIDGRWEVISREDIKRRFREGQADILLCTEAAAEGLNFQFCGALVNYDMPWNPMRVEQRIGRIDRLGQAFATMRIVNLHYEDTVETDVYISLRKRIQLFTQFVGKLQPILASLPRGILETVLSEPHDRAKKRRELVSHIEDQVQATERSGFDLDEITDAELEEPPRPPARYSLDELDALLRQSSLLPPGIEVETMAKREYEYSCPGMPRPIRVTTDPEYFDEHPGSLELWSPGSPIFPSPEDIAPLDEVLAAGGRLRTVLAVAHQTKPV